MELVVLKIKLSLTDVHPEEIKVTVRKWTQEERNSELKFVVSISLRSGRVRKLRLKENKHPGHFIFLTSCRENVQGELYILPTCTSLLLFYSKFSSG